MRNGWTLWFTGLSGAGKTTVARLVENELVKLGRPRVQLLDGDLMREETHRDLGFTRDDRIIHIKRAAWVAALLNGHGVAVLASFITPYREMREYCRRRIPGYHEVYVKCSLETCIERDVKGLYRKALAGEIDHFTGISDPYEEPPDPDLVLDTETETPEQSAGKVLDFLESRGLIGAGRGSRG
ncbi:adenylyl-sulfate kinase [Staphylospora marina]|uniref:adenylyl-sulfate kinase n=1 Tax=Staphylospora marina TaxID=2490858 RepID=UPI000F5C15B3|nr:adenylyl-sulfate kinase [Staphylospora marina]